MANILIVDDDKRLVEHLCKRLTAEGHTCASRGNGEEALQLIQRDSVDLVILDVMIPGLSGFELCRRIHDDIRFYRLPILFLSAMNDSEEIDHGLAQGADDYVCKPFSTDVLVQRVSKLLEDSAQTQMTDELTSLPGPRYVKLEIQKAINEKRRFALAYIEMLHLREFGATAGNEAREKAMRHLARGMHLCSKQLSDCYFREGHMGGGHFVCLIDPKFVGSFCERVYEVWQGHMPELYASIGKENLLAQAESGGTKGRAEPLLDLLCCVTVRDPGTNVSANQLFEVLTNLRQKALVSQGGGVCVDRRG